MNKDEKKSLAFIRIQFIIFLKETINLAFVLIDNLIFLMMKSDRYEKQLDLYYTKRFI